MGHGELSTQGPYPASLRKEDAGYWHGPAASEVTYWRQRALAAEAEVRRLLDAMGGRPRAGAPT